MATRKQDWISGRDAASRLNEEENPQTTWIKPDALSGQMDFFDRVPKVQINEEKQT